MIVAIPILNSKNRSDTFVYPLKRAASPMEPLGESGRPMGRGHPSKQYPRDV